MGQSFFFFFCKSIIWLFVSHAKIVLQMFKGTILVGLLSVKMCALFEVSTVYCLEFDAMQNNLSAWIIEVVI